MAGLDGRTAIVTGGEQGIGEGIVRRLRRDGARVCIGFKQEDDRADAEALAAELGEGGAVALPCDVTREADVIALFDGCREAFGDPDIVVCNAGVSTLLPLAEVTEEEYGRIFDVNCKGTLLCLKHAAQRVRDGGRVVCVSSSTTLFPVSGAHVYAGSKAAVKQFVSAAALELGPRGVTVNAVLPGVTDTPMTARLPQEFKDRVAADTPLATDGRLGRPEHIADAVGLLVSDDARWISGQHILVNGGANH